MEYYSTIKGNEIELLVVRWMDLETVIQTEVSQKEENQYCAYIIYAHIYIYGIKNNGFAEARGRTGINMQTERIDFRRRGGGRVSLDEVRQRHGDIYTPKCNIDS